MIETTTYRWSLTDIWASYPWPFIVGAMILVGLSASPLLGQWTSCSGGSTTCTTNSVGIGNANPQKTLDVSKGSVVGGGIQIDGTNDTRVTIGMGEPTVWSWSNGWETPGDFSLIQEGVSGSVIYVKPGGNVGIGTTSPVHPLQVAGTIGAEAIIVSSTGADYVFQPGYRLIPLTEVATYIQQNHHLPDIPSANEVQEKGLNLGDIQTKLLAKVEELTLHMIELEKQNQELKERLARVEVAAAPKAKEAPDAARLAETHGNSNAY